MAVVVAELPLGPVAQIRAEAIPAFIIEVRFLIKETTQAGIDRSDVDQVVLGELGAERFAAGTVDDPNPVDSEVYVFPIGRIGREGFVGMQEIHVINAGDGIHVNIVASAPVVTGIGNVGNVAQDNTADFDRLHLAEGGVTDKPLHLLHRADVSVRRRPEPAFRKLHKVESMEKRFRIAVGGGEGLEDFLCRFGVKASDCHFEFFLSF